MKKLQKLALNKGKLMTSSQLKSITGGNDSDIGCFYCRCIDGHYIFCDEGGRNPWSKQARETCGTGGYTCTQLSDGGYE